MLIEINRELVEKAMKSNCNICGKAIKPYHLWKYSETKRGTICFIHSHCIYPSKTMEKEKNDDRI